ncbi:hypothetical protein Tco_1028076 [Tanacetum coccineum]
MGERDEFLLQLKQNLLAAKNCMEMKANRYRWEVEFNPGNGIEEVSDLPEELCEGHPVKQPLLAAYSTYNLEDKVNFKEGRNVTIAGHGLGRGKRTRKPPVGTRNI